ncbi:MAG: hypothetical protein SFW36_05405 [Leptolyngbyaceae cyanobacterium bins.59]|nr:hypothetical protein [Leptolyngbyaceae cyanobacterium bins.59]
MKNRLLRVEQLTEGDRDAMYELLSRHFETVNRSQFEQDLQQKNWVILLEDAITTMLAGFTTLLMYETTFADDKFSVVYSGDTIVDPKAWSSSILARSWLAAVKKLRYLYPEGKLYWLLISSGYRTYRFLPVFSREFYPRYDVVTPPNVQQFMNFLAQGRFGDHYDVTTGIVKFSHPQVLRSPLRVVPTERLQDPHVCFFEQCNPGHVQGDELVCLTEICEENLTRAGLRLWYADQNKNSSGLPLLDGEGWGAGVRE